MREALLTSARCLLHLPQPNRRLHPALRLPNPDPAPSSLCCSCSFSIWPDWWRKMMRMNHLITYSGELDDDGRPHGYCAKGS